MLLSCPEGTAPAVHATRGRLIAGCPAAPALSKVALAAPCQRVLAMRTVVGADLWIDDISVDCESSSARLAAKNALLVSRALLQELRGAGHLPSLKKSYFVCVCVRVCVARTRARKSSAGYSRPKISESTALARTWASLPRVPADAPQQGKRSACKKA